MFGIVSHMTRSRLEFLRDAVQSRVEREGLRPLSARTGIPVGQLRSVMEGRAPLSTSIEFIASALGFEFYIGPPREPDSPGGASRVDDSMAVTVHSEPPVSGDERVPAWAVRLQHDLRGVRDDLARILCRAKDDAPPDAGSMPEDPPLSSEPRDPLEIDYVAIRTLDPANGGGPEIELAPVVGYLAFQRKWLERHRMDPGRCTIIEVRGDAMEPTLPEGCSILVDHKRQRRRLGHIFVLRFDDDVMVRRAGRDQAGRWTLVSDHHLRDPIPWSRESQVSGEVRWMARILT